MSLPHQTGVGELGKLLVGSGFIPGEPKNYSMYANSTTSPVDRKSKGAPSRYGISEINLWFPAYRLSSCRVQTLSWRFR